MSPIRHWMLRLTTCAAALTAVPMGSVAAAEPSAQVGGIASVLADQDPLKVGGVLAAELEHAIRRARAGTELAPRIDASAISLDQAHHMVSLVDLDDGGCDAGNWTGFATSGDLYGITGLGLRAAGDNVTTVWVQRRLIRSDGSMGDPIESRSGTVPGNGLERVVYLPDGFVATGVIAQIDAPDGADTNVYTLKLYARRLLAGGKLSPNVEVFRAENSGDNGTELNVQLPLPYILNNACFRSNSANAGGAIQGRAPFFTPQAGVASSTWASLECPAGREAIGTVGIRGEYNQVAGVGQFGLVCRSKVSVTNGTALNSPTLAQAEGGMTVIRGAFVDPTTRLAEGSGSQSLSSYRSTHSNEIVSLCPAGYSLDAVSGREGQGATPFIRRITSIRCNKRANVPGDAVRVGQVNGLGDANAAGLDFTLDIPNASSGDGLRVAAGAVTEAISIHYFRR